MRRLQYQMKKSEIPLATLEHMKLDLAVYSVTDTQIQIGALEAKASSYASGPVITRGPTPTDRQHAQPDPENETVG